MASVKIFAPASVGNIGPAFDVLGMAVDCSGDVVEAIETESPGVKLEVLGKSLDLPKNPEKNTAGLAAIEVMKKLNIKKGLKLRLKKGLSFGSGLGSSAASAVAAGYAVAKISKKNVRKKDLVEPITKAEEKVSGSFFCDNTASSLLGGVVLTRSYNPLEIHKLGSLEGVYFAFVKPDIKILTEDARKVIPKKVPLDNIKVNNANTAGLVAAVKSNDKRLFGKCIDDKIIEPARAGLIKGFKKVKKVALLNNALGASISGAGPTIFAACEDKKTAQKVCKKMEEAFLDEELKSESFISKMDKLGARVVEE